MIAVVAAALLAAASPVVDRTYTCTMKGLGFPDPYRVLDVTVWPRTGDVHPYLNVHNGTSRGADMKAGLHTGPWGEKRTGELWVTRQPCTATTRRVELSSRGLRSGSTRRSIWHHECDVPGRVVVRIRAVFARPVTLRLERGFWVTRGAMTSAALAVRTFEGQPLVYATSDAERTRLFVARGRCTQE